MPDILVSEAITGAALDALGREFDVAFEPDLWQNVDTLTSRIAQVRGVIVRNQTPLCAAVLSAAPRLQIIARAGVGLDNIDVDFATAAGIVIAWTPMQHSITVAELTLGMMLDLSRNIASADRDTKAGGWRRHHFTGVELSGKTVGIVGLGRIGVLVAKRAKAFGMELIAHDPPLDAQSPAVQETGALLCDLDTLMARADYICLHLPANDQTRGIIDRALLAKCKPSAMLINLARGEVIDEPALIEALAQGRLRGAALDVRAVEPPARDALCDMDNVILTPHIGAFTREAQTRVVQSVCDDVTAVLRGGEAECFVNFSTPRRSPP